MTDIEKNKALSYKKEGKEYIQSWIDARVVESPLYTFIHHQGGKNNKLLTRTENDRDKIFIRKCQ